MIAGRLVRTAAALSGLAYVLASCGAPSATGSVSSTGDPGSSTPPWVYDDFSQYTSTGDLLTNTRPTGSLGTWAHINQNNTQQIVLDTTAANGQYAPLGLKQAMRYDYAACAGSTNCADYTVALGYLMFPTPVTEGWVEWVAKFAPTFQTNNPNFTGSASAAYKFFLIYTQPDGTRVGTTYTYTSQRTIEYLNAIVEDSWGIPNANQYWDGKWHVYRMHYRLSAYSGDPNGLVRFWVDGVKQFEQTGFSWTAAGPGPATINGLAGPANMNQGSYQNASVWFARWAAWSTDPGWGG